MDAEIVRAQGLDKFYTKPEVAKKCMDILYSKISNFDLTVEPSAGNGVFIEYILGNKKCIDISPEHPEIQEMDFFNFSPSSKGKILVVGNPPFGKCSSLAVRFFNHSAEFADTIAFIVPRTFRRRSIQNRLNLSFELILDMELDINPCPFTTKINVKCCFQVWKKVNYLRVIQKLPTTHPHFQFVKYGPKDVNNQPTPPEADFAIRAYGQQCGQVIQEELYDLRPKSWHFIKVSNIISKQELLSNLEKIDYSVTTNTARQNSLGKADLVNLYENTIRNL